MTTLDESWGHNVKLNKPVIKEQILLGIYKFAYMRCLLTEADSNSWTTAQSFEIWLLESWDSKLQKHRATN